MLKMVRCSVKKALSILVILCFLAVAAGRLYIGRNTAGSGQVRSPENSPVIPLTDSEKEYTEPVNVTNPGQQPLKINPLLLARRSRDDSGRDLVTLPGNPISGGNSLIDSAELLDVRDVPGKSAGELNRTKLIRIDLKYPMILVKESIAVEPVTKRQVVVQSHAMVADHITVRLRPSATEADLVEFNRVHGGRIIKRIDGAGLFLVEFPGSDIDTLDEKIADYSAQHTLLSYAEPDYLVYAVQNIPDDPRFDELWGMHNTGQSGGTVDADIDAPEAWSGATGTDVPVAVIDTGVDYTHEDLAANIWVNPGETAGNSIDDDGNGYVDDIHGIDVYNSDSDPMDDNNHGSHCSGTIAAVGNNGIGVVGVCWSARIMGVKFLSAAGYGYTSDAVECVNYAAMMGARVMNNSWGGGGFSQAMYDAIDAAGQSNSLFCAAGGNSARDNDLYPHYPSSYSNANLIAVAAFARDNTLSYFTCWGGESVDLAAPGSAILSTIPGNGYVSWNGTSMATPHCSGAAALLVSRNPAIQVMELRQALMDNVDPVPAFEGKLVSGGRLNVQRSLDSVFGMSFDRQSYFAGELASVTLVDTNLSGAGVLVAEITTGAGDSENLSLIEKPGMPHIFTNSILTAYGTAVVSNDTVEGVEGTVIYASYTNVGLGEVYTGSAVFDLALDIKLVTQPGEVSFAVTNFQVTGYNNGSVRVDMIVSNEATGGTVTFQATNNWTAPPILLATNASRNMLWISGTNIYGNADAESVLIIRTGPDGMTNYVSQTGSHQWPYISWVTASTNINEAMIAAPAGGFVLVTNGTWTGGPAVVDKAVTLSGYGGAAGTILDGEYSTRCLIIRADAVVEGFTIINGYESTGAGVFMSDGELRNCVIADNEAYDYGGGIYFDQGGRAVDCIIRDNIGYDGGGAEMDHGGLVSNCVVSGNMAWSIGGGLDLYGNGTVYGCTITNNISWLYGGGMEVWDNGLINNCLIAGNWTEYDGGGVDMYFGETTIVMNNSLISGNTAGGYGGGVSFWLGGTINNCTIMDNTAARGGGIYCLASGRVRNSIVYYNSAAKDAEYYIDDVGSSFENVCSRPAVAGTNNIAEQPLLIGLANPHIMPGSPCIDAGTNLYASGFDLDGESRVSGASVDIGCDEFTSGTLTGELSVAIQADSTTLAVDYEMSFGSAIVGLVSNYVWSFSDGNYATNEVSIAHSWTAPGSYPVVLTAYNQDYPGGVSATALVQVLSGISYVSSAGGNTAPYESWSAAATDIQSAINIAPYGGTVVVTDGVYAVNSRVEQGLTNRIAVYKPVRVRSVNGPAVTIVQGAAGIRCAYISAGGALSGFTLENGSTTAAGDWVYERCGGGVFMDMGGIISNCVVRSGTANSRGGGIYCYQAGEVIDCVVSNSYATYYGGGIYCYYGGIVSGTLISSNSAGYDAGGLYLYLGGSGTNTTVRNNLASRDGGGVALTRETSLQNCQIELNLASNRAGGVWMNYGGTLEDCNVQSNTSVWNGGGLYFQAGGTLDRCTVEGNESVTQNGGGMLMTRNSYINNCLIRANHCKGAAGGVYLFNGGEMNNCTVTENISTNYDGGIVCWGGTVRNSIIYYNTAPLRPNWKTNETADITYSCTTPALPWLGNITNEPGFKDAAAQNYRLLLNAECINSGNTEPAGLLDIDRAARVMEGTVDMGAYEYNRDVYDTDGDGYPDGYEQDNGSDPLDELSGLAGPSWWWCYGLVLNTNSTPNDFAAVNAGQVKWTALQAYRAATNSTAWSPGGADELAIDALIGSFSVSNNYGAVNIGQVKHIAGMYYDWLGQAYPWTGYGATNDFAIVNIGQVKQVFSFNIPQ